MSIDALLAEDSGSIPALIRHHATARPGACALIAGDAAGDVAGKDALDYAGLDALMDQVAAALARDGVGPGGVVAIVAAPSIRYLAGYLGAVRAGAAVAPLQPSLAADSLAAMLADARASHVRASRRRAGARPRSGSSSSRPVTRATP